MRKFFRFNFIILILLILSVFIYEQIPERQIPANTFADEVVVIKHKKRMDLLKNGDVLKSFRVSIGKNEKGDKQQHGDGRTPEGRYRLIWKNPNSDYYLSIKISYPDHSDILRARRKGVDPGGDIFIHGVPDWMRWFSKMHRWFGYTQGCIMVTNREMDEIWRTVPAGTPIEIRP